MTAAVFYSVANAGFKSSSWRLWQWVANAMIVVDSPDRCDENEWLNCSYCCASCGLVVCSCEQNCRRLWSQHKAIEICCVVPCRNKFRPRTEPWETLCGAIDWESVLPEQPYNISSNSGPCCLCFSWHHIDKVLYGLNASVMWATLRLRDHHCDCQCVVGT